MGHSIRHGRALAAACLLSACAGAGPPPKPPPPAAVMSVAARLAAPPAQAVEVRLANVPPGRRIERVALVDPRGTRHEARSLAPVSVSEGGLEAGPRFGIGVTGGSSSGVRPSISLGWNVLGSRAERRSRRVEARVPLPDPAAYRADTRRWRVEVVFTEIDGARRTLTFPAGPR